MKYIQTELKDIQKREREREREMQSINVKLTDLRKWIKVLSMRN